MSTNPPAGDPRISPYLNHEDSGAVLDWLASADPEGHHWYFASRTAEA